MKRLYMYVFLLALVNVSCSIHYHKRAENSVTLYLKAPEAQTVLLYSSLDGFRGTPLTHRSGKWLLATFPSDRTFRYFYTIDGQVYIPPCKRKETDDFGSSNCLFEPEM